MNNGCSSALDRRAFISHLGRGVLVGSACTGLGAVLTGAAEPLATPYLTRRFFALGTKVVLIVNHPDRRLAQAAASRAVRAVFAVHEEMTCFEPSPLTHVNQVAYSRPVDISAQLAEVLGQAIEVSVESQGLFDVTLGRLRRALLALQRGEVRDRDGRREIEAARESCGPGRLSLDRLRRQVRLLHPRTTVDLNAIAKGYAVDQAAASLRHHGLHDFLINAGGDIYAAGSDGRQSGGWRIFLDGPPPTTQRVLELVVTDRAVATSGNHQRRLLASGRHEAHLVDPLTGGSSRAMASATVLADSATRADAWATAAFVAGLERSPTLLRAQTGLEAYLLSHRGRLMRAV